MTQEERAELCRRIASEGGRACVKAHGRAHMREIGRKGYRATLDRHWGGEADRFAEWFSARGLAAQDPAPWNGYHQRVPDCPYTKGE
jgi:general stress protein YciG